MATSKMKVLAGIAAFLLAVFTVAAAAPAAHGTNKAPPATSSTASGSAAQSATAGDEFYRLGTGDKLRVTVYGEEDLSGEFLVDGSSQVQLPLVGQVKAAGLTVHNFVTEVTAALRSGYLRNPKVSIEVLNYRPFYIMGEVNKPGEYPYEHGLTALQAVALAGGFTYRADDDDVYVRRADSKLEQRMPADDTTRIYPGDVIRVSERIF